MLAFCGGALLVHGLPRLPAAAWLVIPVLVALLAVRRWSILSAACCGFALTAGLASLQSTRDWPCARDRNVVQVTGRVLAPPVVRGGRVEFDLEVIEPTALWPLAHRWRLSWYDAPRVPAPGQIWRLSARLRCRRGFANPGAPDRELDLMRQGIGATGYLVTDSAPVLLESNAPNADLQRSRARIADHIALAAGPGPSAAVLQGLAVGVRGNLPDALWDAFAVTGIAHLMAISGLHVTGCALLALMLLRLAWRLPWLARIRARIAIETVVLVGTTTAYTLMAGASIPALRTLAMVAIVALQRLLRRSLPVHETLAIAAILLMIPDPFAIASAGFWLSFAATATLLAVVQDGTGWMARLAVFARAQLAIMALLTPVLSAAFGRFSLIAPAANAIAIPLFGFVLLPLVLSATLVDAVSATLAAPLWRVIAWMLDGVWPPLLSVATWPWISWAPAAQPPALLAAAGLLTLAALLLPLAGLRLACFALLLAIVLGDTARPAADAWNLHVLDVGQGLAAVVETRHHVLVFDTGPSWRGGLAAARVSLLPYLRSRGIRRIDRLVISHDDADHAGGAELLAQSFDVRRRISGPGAEPPLTGSVCRRGESWHWDGVDFRFLHPPTGMIGSDNDRSCALGVSGAGGRALLLADPETAAEESMLEMPIGADVVLLPHHGSRSSSTPAFVAAIGARLGIASAGFGNRWGMPATDVRARWQQHGTTVMTTARDGAITVRFGARTGDIRVETERGGDRHWWRQDALD